MCSFWLKDASQAEDAVQEVYIKAYKALPNSGMSAARKHGCCALQPMSAGICRRAGGRASSTEAWTSPTCPEPAYEMAEHDDELIQAIQALPAKYSEVILLHFWQHMSLTEIAAILNTSLSTVSRRLTDAKKRLRKQLEEGNL